MTRAFIVKITVDPSIDPETIQQEIDFALSDVFNSGEYSVEAWSEHSSSSPTTAPPLAYPPL